MRREGWEQLLAEHVADAGSTDFQWGQADCALWCADWVRKATGQDFSTDWRGQYATEEELQAWFVRRLDDHLARRGRRLYGWEEILEGGLAGSVSQGATVASWRGMTGAIAAARAGHDVVACPDDQVYLDYRQSDRSDEPIPVGTVLTIADVYRFNPVPIELTQDEAQHVLGGQANIWTEHMDSPRTVDYFAFPRLCALAEALWLEGERDYDEFAGRLDQHLARLDAIGVEYRRSSGPLPWQQRPGITGRIVTPQQRAAYLAPLTARIASAAPAPAPAPAAAEPTTISAVTTGPSDFGIGTSI